MALVDIKVEVSLRRGSLLVVPFRAARGDDPEEMFGGQEFCLSVDPKGQVAVFFADAEPKDLLQMEEAADNVFPLFVVNRFDVAPAVLRLFNSSVWIVKKDLAAPSRPVFSPGRKGKRRTSTKS
jgi:hypothetical protein